MKLYWEVGTHVRGSVTLAGSTKFRPIHRVVVANPLQPYLDADIPEEKAILDNLLREVVASGVYSFYEWDEADE